MDPEEFDNPMLEEFRAEWERELGVRDPEDQHDSDTEDERHRDLSSADDDDDIEIHSDDGDPGGLVGVGGGGGGEYDGSGVADESGLTARQREARTLYRRATNYEMDGEHMDAIRYYRRAFRLDPSLEMRQNVADLVREVEAVRIDNVNSIVSQFAEEEAGLGDAPPPTPPPGLEFAFVAPVFPWLSSEEYPPLMEPELPPGVIRTTPRPAFSWHSLPSELHITILSYAGAEAVSRCALACKYLHALSFEPLLWRAFCTQTRSVESCKVLMEAHGWSWRELFTHAERVLSDGVYICRVVYYRRGQKELATFYDSMQKVVYWRYLRFWDNGMVASLCTPEHPHKVARLFGTDAAAAANVAGRDNFYAGSYNIQDGSVFITLDGGDRIYSMILAIRHLKSARNGKLVMEEYTAVNPTSQKETNFGLTGLDAYKFKFFSLEAMTTLR